MKKSILYIVLFLIVSVGLKAQEPARQEMPPQQPVSPEAQMKMFVDRISPKLNLTKNQKDSLAMIFLKFMDDLQKYHAENNEKVVAFMTKNRDDKVKNLLRDSTKYFKYTIILTEISKQTESQPNSIQPLRHGGQHNNMGGGRTY